jgi:hypothetical protein
MPATTDTRKKISAHFRSVMIDPPALQRGGFRLRGTLF